MSDKNQAKQEIDKKLKEAHDLISECENLADQHGLGFSWDLAYGMGGWYQGKPADVPDRDEDDYYESDYGWQASSQGC